MTSVSQVGKQLQYVLEERACELARETECVKRLRKFSGADQAAAALQCGHSAR
jgi:hypothetical protein